MINRNYPSVVSIVITYNGEKWVEACFSSLTNAKLSDHTILAIDNGSTDRTIQILEDKFPSVKIIKNNSNLGFGKANNLGFSFGLKNNADYFFLLNQDAWLKENTLEQLIEISQNNPEYGILSPVHLNANLLLDPGFAYYCLQNHQSKFLADAFSKNFTEEIYSSEFINAAAWLLPRRTIEIVGGFMPIFPHYGEDLNYCERVNFNGLKIGFTPGLTIIHDRDMKNRKHNCKKRLNLLYVFLLGYFVSNKYSGKKYFCHCLKGIAMAVKTYFKHPKTLILLPFALLKVLRSLPSIIANRRQAFEKSLNFLLV